VTKWIWHGVVKLVELNGLHMCGVSDNEAEEASGDQPGTEVVRREATSPE
jgi:hypothetical protein